MDEALKSRLSRLRTCLAAERRYWKETGEGIDEPESEEVVKELVEIGKRSISEELAKEFETVLQKQTFGKQLISFPEFFSRKRGFPRRDNGTREPDLLRSSSSDLELPEGHGGRGSSSS